MSKINSLIATEVLNIIENKIKIQIEKGFNKYGKTLDNCQVGEHDFLNMALEECIDGMQYLVKKIAELKNENQQLKLDNQYLSSRLQKAVNPTSAIKAKYMDIDD